jgi:hypothetical protein
LFPFLKIENILALFYKKIYVDTGTMFELCYVVVDVHFSLDVDEPDLVLPENSAICGGQSLL